MEEGRPPHELRGKVRSFAPGNDSLKVLTYFKIGVFAFLMQRRWQISDFFKPVTGFNKWRPVA